MDQLLARGPGNRVGIIDKNPCRGRRIGPDTRFLCDLELVCPQQVLRGVGGPFAMSTALLAVTLAGYDPARTVFRSINLGREESAEGFSGRAGVWSMLLPYIAARPIQGYGYESFWTPEHLADR